VVLASALLCLPGIRTIAWHGDEGILLHGAQRMLHGEWLYRDFFEFIPPLGFVLTAGWLSVTDGSFLATRVLLLLQIVAIASLTYLTCLRVSGRAALSGATATAWVLAIKVIWFQTSHHLFTTMFSAVTVWALVKWLDEREQKNWLVVLAGLSGGAAAMCTSTRSALVLLAGLAAFGLMRRQLTPLVAYGLAALAVPTLLVVYLGSGGALWAAYEDVIVYLALHYAGIQWVPYGDDAHIGNLGVPFILPLAGVLLLLNFASNWRRASRDRVLHLCAAAAVAAFAGHLVRPHVV